MNKGTRPENCQGKRKRNRMMNKDETDFRSNEELQKLIQKNEASLQAKGRLIDNMAYQIRTLSNAVIGFSDLLLSESAS